MNKGFVIGNPRSGTTLLRLMLNAHPDITAPPESGFLQWWFQKYSNWSKEDNEKPKKRQQFIRDIFSSKKIETWGLNEEILDHIIQVKKPSHYGALITLVYEAYAVGMGKNPQLILDKNNYYINHLTLLKQIWPEASFIFIIRDGRDVASSYLEVNKLQTQSPYRPNLPNNIASIAKEWYENNQKVLNFMEHENSNSLLIRYEDMVIHPKQTLDKLMNFFGLSYAPDMIEFYKQNDEPKSTIDWKKNTLQPVDAKSIGKYNYGLTKKEVAKFEEIAGSLLKTFNYI